MSTPPTSLSDNILGGTTTIHFVANAGVDDTHVCFPWMVPLRGESLSSIMEERTDSCTDSPVVRISVAITPPTPQAPTETTRRSGSKRGRGDAVDDEAAGVDTYSASGGEPPRSLMRRVEARAASLDSYLTDSDPLSLVPTPSSPIIRTTFHLTSLHPSRSTSQRGSSCVEESLEPEFSGSHNEDGEHDDANTFTLQPRDSLEPRYSLGGIDGDEEESEFESDDGDDDTQVVMINVLDDIESLLAAFLGGDPQGSMPLSLFNAMSFLASVTLPQNLPPAPRGVPVDQLRALETFHVRDPIEGASECSICQCTLSEQPTPKCPCPGCSSDTMLLVKMPACGHVFHEACLLPWLRTSNTCPNCRSEFPVATPN